MSKFVRIKKQSCIIGSDYSAQEPRLTASISNEQSIIDGYNLRNEEFPRGKDYYSQLASAAFNLPYWECTEFRKPKKIEEMLEEIPVDYFVVLADGTFKLASDVSIGDILLCEDSSFTVKEIKRTSNGFIFN